MLVDIFPIKETDENNSVAFQSEANAVIADLQSEIILRTFQFLEVRQGI